MYFDIYNAVSKDGFIDTIDKTGKSLAIFSLKDHKRFNKLLKKYQVLMVDWTTFNHGLAVEIFPLKSVFTVVVTNQKVKNTWGDNIWITDLNIKGIRRELKIQGFKDVLCIAGSELNQDIIKNKLLKSLRVTRQAKGRNILSQGIKMLDDLDKTVLKLDIQKTETDGDFIHIHYSSK